MTQVNESSRTVETAALIDRLTRDELASVASEVAAGRREHILNSLGERGRAQELVRQQYSGRYPFELLQNANDAAGSGDGGGGRVRFVVGDGALLVADQGAGFGPEQVRAICGLGRSSKDPRKSIGYKGLGFKSVGEITDHPQIICGGLRFGFDELRARSMLADAAGGLPQDQRIPAHGLPFVLTDHDLGVHLPLVQELLDDGFRTVLRLPFRDDVSRAQVADQVSRSIVPRLLLFLDATTELAVEGTEQDFLATAVRVDGDGCTELLLDSDSRTEHFLVFTNQLDIPDRSLVARLGEAWKEVESVRVAVAVPLNDGGFPRGGDPQPVHVYFPTVEETGFPIILQADLALELDRRHIARSPDAASYNEWLLSELATFCAGSVVPMLAERYPGTPGVVDVLTPVRNSTDAGALLADRIVANLTDIAFLPCVDGVPRAPKDARLLPASVSHRELVHRLATEATDHCVLPALELAPRTRQFLKEDLGVPQLLVPDVLAVLDPEQAESDAEYYELLMAWADKAGSRLFANLLRDVRCVRLVDGQWSLPVDTFFPRQRGEVDFPADLPVPIVDVPDRDDLRGLLAQAGVRPFEWRHLVVRILVPLLKDHGQPQATRAAAMTALRSYFRNDRGGDTQVERALGDVLVPARTANQDRTQLRPAREVYFSSAWLGHDRLDLIYGPFGRCEFLDVPLPASDLDDERAMYERLGVAAFPRVDEVTATDRYKVWPDDNPIQVSELPHARLAPDAWLRWRADARVRAASRCPRGHPASQRLRRSLTLDRFVEVVRAADQARLVALFQELAQHWSAAYEGAMTATFVCVHGEHPGTSRAAPSLFASLLTYELWVPAVRAGTALPVPPARAWRVTVDTPRMVREAVAALPRELDTRSSAALAAAVGLVDAARPAPEDLVALLQDLSRSAGTPLVADKARQDAARWAMRTLNDVLPDEPGRLKNIEVPLLARQDGQSIFTARPFVAADRLLAATWEPTHAVLDGDRDLGRLQRHLELRSLDREVEVTPRPLGPVPAVQRKVEHQLHVVRPYLYALAADNSPAQAEVVGRRLRRLEVHVCTRLVVVYRLDDQERERDDETCHIATRIETDGRRRQQHGTAYLQTDPVTGDCDWYRFGRLLAQYLGQPTLGDAVSLLITAGHKARNAYLRSLGLEQRHLDAARAALQQETNDVAADLLPALTDLEGYVPDPRQSSETDPAAIHRRPPSPPPSPSPSPEGSATPSPHAETAPEPPLLDPAKIRVEVVDTEARTGEGNSRQHRSPSGLGPGWPVDFEEQDKRRRDIGERGEEAVYLAERHRLTERGLDPDLVIWVSRQYPHAPYDIESIDEHGPVYIDAKATAGEDPSSPFPISVGELFTAVEKRKRYWIYRVLRADTDSPRILRVQDPVGKVLDGHAQLHLQSARLQLHVSEKPET
jgi:hypothetical protein